MTTAETVDGADTTACTTCSAHLAPGSRFCPSCGEPAGGAPRVDPANPAAKPRIRQRVVIAAAPALVGAAVVAGVALSGGGKPTPSATAPAASQAAATTNVAGFATSGPGSNLIALGAGPAVPVKLDLATGGCRDGLCQLTVGYTNTGSSTFTTSAGGTYLVDNHGRTHAASMQSADRPDIDSMTLAPGGRALVVWQATIPADALLQAVCWVNQDASVTRLDVAGPATPTQTSAVPSAAAVPTPSTPAPVATPAPAPSLTGAAAATASLSAAQQAKYGPMFLNATNTLYARWTDFDVTPYAGTRGALLSSLRTTLPGLRSAKAHYPPALAAAIARMVNPAAAVEHDITTDAPQSQAEADWTTFDNYDAVVLGSLGRYGVGPGND